jgi:hypothetical protein
LNTFDFLVIANAVVAIIAVYQLRVCTLTLAGNCLLLSRALSSIESGGPPASQRIVPIYVFSAENLDTAATILIISLASLVLFTVISRRQRLRIGPDAPEVPLPVLIAIGLYLAAYAGSTTTIFTGGYASESTSRYRLDLAGAHALICSLVVYELARRRLLALITARRAFLTIFTIFFVTHYAKGSTGITTGYLFLSAILFLPRTGAAKKITNVFRIGGVLLVVLALSLVIRGVRGNLHLEGGNAISNFINNTVEMEENREDQAEGAESIANASQTATHMLMCISLYDSGISREWRSIYDVATYTLMPSFFVNWFGWVRPVEAPWELRYYYQHGGGINVLGEFYWNGGWWCVGIMTTLLSFFCFIVDKYYRASPFWLMMVAQFTPSFLMGFGYGFAQVARGAINSLLVALAYKIFVTLRRGQTPPALSHTSITEGVPRPMPGVQM